MGAGPKSNELGAFHATGWSGKDLGGGVGAAGLGLGGVVGAAGVGLGGVVVGAGVGLGLDAGDGVGLGAGLGLSTPLGGAGLGLDAGFHSIPPPISLVLGVFASPSTAAAAVSFFAFSFFSNSLRISSWNFFKLAARVSRRRDSSSVSPGTRTGFSAKNGAVGPDDGDAILTLLLGVSTSFDPVPSLGGAKNDFTASTQAVWVSTEAATNISFLS